MVKRREYGYFIDRSRIDELLEGIRTISKEARFTENYTRSLYFNNSEHEVPLTSSIRARSYSESPLSEATGIDTDSIWLLERNGGIFEEKDNATNEKSISTLHEILDNLGAKKNPLGSGEPIRPYVAASSSRRQFDFEGGFNISVSQGAQYFLLGDKLSLEKIGDEEAGRLELRIEPGTPNLQELTKAVNLLKSLDVVRQLPKVETAYNLLGDRIRRTNFINPGQIDTEIVARFEIQRADQQSFHKIKYDVLNGFVSNFKLKPQFTGTFQSGELINYILREGGKDYLLFMRDPEDGDAVVDDKVEVLSAPSKLDRILKITKGKNEAEAKIARKSLEIVHRKEKRFVIENNGNGNEYSVCLSLNSCKDKDLFLLEVKSLMAEPTKAQERYALLDIADITKNILSRHPYLKRTEISIPKWVRSLNPEQETPKTPP